GPRDLSHGRRQQRAADALARDDDVRGRRLHDDAQLPVYVPVERTEIPEETESQEKQRNGGSASPFLCVDSVGFAISVISTPRAAPPSSHSRSQSRRDRRPRPSPRR